MNFDALETLLRRKNQRFTCTDHFWPERGPARRTVSLTHDVLPPLTGAELNAFKAQVGEVPQLVEFYARYGGLNLFRDALGSTFAFRVGHPDQWQNLRAEFQQWIHAFDDGDDELALLPDWRDDVIVFGEIPGSGNYFLTPMHGPEQGKVFEFEHDGFEFIERGADLNAFIDTLCRVDEAGLSTIVGHTRYRDPQGHQWMPFEYLFDAEPAPE